MIASAADHWESLKVFITEYYEGGKTERGMLKTQQSSFSVSNDQRGAGPKTDLLFPPALGCKLIGQNTH